MVKICELCEENREMAEELKKYAEETGRIAALLHYAQRDIARLDSARIILGDTEFVGIDLRSAIDASIAAKKDAQG
ncbi:hypothetical protein XALC_0201 [Xanthomonas albilineans GPE PC73]|uniref:Uncharacterized protein n=2 Tax=Xanthomonas albilineans TaxID=29447 RepID=D2U9F8_XANAP|nr:hypothetical protein XALC_0201 [Xanthomonas albilineans GPE PC73]